MKYVIYAMTDNYETVQLGSTWSRDLAWSIYLDYKDRDGYLEVYLDEPIGIVQVILETIGI